MIMPNGGIDNCGTCWFNTKNKGEAGHGHVHDAGEHYCIIRKQPIIEDPFHTYCANSPYNTSTDPDAAPNIIDTPIGPIFVTLNGQRDYTRVQWIPSPNSEETRLRLLKLLAVIVEQPDDYAGNMAWDDMVIWQLGEFREKRAVEDLKRIAAFNPEAKAAPSSASIGLRTRHKTVQLAQEALSKI